MKSFIKTLLAVILGCLLAGIIAFFVLTGAVGALMSKKPADIKPGTLLHIDLNCPIADRSHERNPLDNAGLNMDVNLKVLGLNDILKALSYAKTDDRISGILIEQSGFGGGLATLEEVRNALIDFKQSGKFIVSHSDIYSQRSYYMASVADRLYLTPEGDLDWRGLASEIKFYANLLKKYDIDAEIIRHGKFKSAVEPFMLDKMSPENREQTLTYLGSIWKHWLQGVSQARNISVERLNQMADDMAIRDAQRAVDNGMIDALLYRDQLLDTLRMLTNTPSKKDIETIKLGKYAKDIMPDPAKLREKNKIAVVYASGEINMGKGSDEVIGSDGLSRTIRKARCDSSIKAIVLRINSPGGSALASEVIWREVTLAKAVKPVIVSMGNLAASGGYYIAAPATAIVANPTTITGSIGVFGLVFNVRRAVAKYGLNVDGVTTNKHAGMGSLFGASLTAEERDIIQQSVESIYSTFISHVAEGRGITTEQVDEIGQGRVWSGANAMEIKLIDRFGGLNDAIALAAEKAELDSYRIVELPKAESSMDKFMKSFGETRMSADFGEFSTIYNRLKYLSTQHGTVQAMLPYEVEIR